jgi:uncharacterized protein YfiM (DUF2279 family)
MKFAKDNWTGQDKLIHFLGCGFIVPFLCRIALYFACSILEVVIFALITVLILSIIKEILDCQKANPTDFSYKDIVWGMIGGFTGIVPFII